MRYSTDSMRNRYSLLLTVLLFVQVSLHGEVADQSLSENPGPEWVYLFVSGDLSAKQGRGNYPVLAMTKRHLLLDKGTTTRRISKDAPIMMRLKPSVSYSIVGVNKFDYSFSSTIPATIEARAMSEMMRHEIGTDTALSTVPRTFGAGGRSRLDYDQIEELTQDNVRFREDLIDETDQLVHYAEKIVDTIHLDLELSPEIDYEDAYVAVAVGENNAGGNPGVGSNSQVVVGYLGTMRANQVERFKLRMALRPFVGDNAVCELFLFCEEGKAIATDISRELKKLTREQLANLVRPQK